MHLVEPEERGTLHVVPRLLLSAVVDEHGVPQVGFAHQMHLTTVPASVPNSIMLRIAYSLVSSRVMIYCSSRS